MLSAVEWGIYLYIPMGTTMSTMLLFTVVKDTQCECGSHAIVFKSLSFGPCTLKRNPGVLKLKRGLQRFQPRKRRSRVNYRVSVAKVMRFKTKTH